MKKRKLCMIFLLCLALMTLVAGCRSKKETNDQGHPFRKAPKRMESPQPVTQLSILCFQLINFLDYNTNNKTWTIKILIAMM